MLRSNIQLLAGFYHGNSSASVTFDQYSLFLDNEGTGASLALVKVSTGSRTITILSSSLKSPRKLAYLSSSVAQFITNGLALTEFRLAPDHISTQKRLEVHSRLPDESG
ncbi:1566_t:CDS:2 [Acaulospora colombiana]|uniref:1566_t:CDS:1 n=1 Tax=Acaulospora colombiana TaxID=27376 RepID=A0ACA9PPK8_9GLOM|nr:1566_t:CDS:2 [Acaulospora colombiana]